MNNSCPYCSVEHEMNVPNTEMAGKLAKTGPYYLCPTCSSPFERNLHWSEAPLFTVGAVILGLFYGTVAFFLSKVSDTVGAIFLLTFLPIAFGVSLYLKIKLISWPRWKKRVSDF